MTRLRTVALTALLPLLAASGALADQAAACQTLRLAVELPHVLALSAPAAEVRETALFVLIAPRTGQAPVSQTRPCGRLMWATWASRSEPRSVTAQLSSDLPPGVRLDLRLSPTLGHTAIRPRDVTLSSSAVSVLDHLSGGGLQEAAIGYEAGVTPGTPPTSLGLTVIYTLAD